MNGIVDELDRHLPRAGSIERAAVPTGMYVAWCANLQLLSAAFQAEHESALTRLRYRDISPAEFFVSACHGSFSEEDLGAEGRSFTARYYSDYLTDFEQTFAADAYSVADDWAHYDKIAALLTSRFMSTKASAGERADRRKRWWRIWR